MEWITRIGGRGYLPIRIARSGAADDTLAIYDIGADSWSSEIDGFAAGENDFSTNSMGFSALAVDDFIYQWGITGTNFVLRRLSADLVTDIKVGSVAQAGSFFAQIDDNTFGNYSTTTGVEIDTDGTITNPTAYDALSAQITLSNFPVSNFTTERLGFRTNGRIYRIDIAGADITWVARFSGWIPLDPANAALNNAADAFSVYPFDQTTSPPSQSLDWIDVLPKTAEHASIVEIRPVDYVSAGSPGTLGELPDVVFALRAGP